MAEIKNTKGEIITIQDPMIGSLSDDILLKKVNEQSPAEIESELYRKLKRYEKDGEILWGTITGVEGLNEHAVFSVLWNGLTVYISDDSYFEPRYSFGKNYQLLSEHEKYKYRVREGMHKMGALIPFRIVHADRHTISSGTYEG